METEKTKKMIFKSKPFWIIAIAVAIAIIGIVSFYIIKVKNAASQDSTSVQSAIAEPGSISSTVKGTGTLSLGPATNIDVPVGVQVENVLASSGDTVTNGQVLATLNEASIAETLLNVEGSIETIQAKIKALPASANDSTTKAYLEKIVLQSEMSYLLSEKDMLSNLFSTLAITASVNGTISSVNVTENSTVTKSSSQGSSGTPSSTPTNTSPSGGASSGSKSSASGSVSKIDSVSASFLKASYSQERASARSQADASSTSASLSPKLIKEITSLIIKTPAAGQSPQSSLVIEDTSVTGYSGTINWDAGEAFEAGKYYTATILLTSKEGFAFTSADNLIVTIPGAVITSDTPKVIGGSGIEGNSVYIKAVFQTNSDKTGSDTNGSEQIVPSTNTDEAPSATASTDDGVSSGSSSTTASTTIDSSSASSLSSYSSFTATAFSIASADTMKLSVIVDELDINSVKSGQSASLSIDALSTQPYTGKITQISSASNNTGSGTAKYSVTITVPKADGMKIGMNASAVIVVNETTNAVLIPVNALQEDGNTAFVYTQKDSDGNLTGKKEVKTGLSDGSQVAVTSGLSTSDTVYYLKTGSDSSDTEYMSGDISTGDSGISSDGGKDSGGK